MKIGFIGLGKMGAGMAANLLGAGHDVTVSKPGHPDLHAFQRTGVQDLWGLIAAERFKPIRKRMRSGILMNMCMPLLSEPQHHTIFYTGENNAKTNNSGQTP